MKISIFTGGTSVKSKNIFTDISRYPTGKHEIKPTMLANKALINIERLETTYKQFTMRKWVKQTFNTKIVSFVKCFT